ncbi:MAG: CBS domain-containing protein [Oligoflexales bacterium]|nr:CBS domain-containing protein [Oligoflexales bacterium]
MHFLIEFKIFDSDSLWKVEELLTKNGFEDLIVVDKNLQPTGYLSVHKCFQHVLDYGFQNAESTTVGKLMEASSDSVLESDPLGLAIDYFAEKGNRNFLPVVNASNRMQGYLCRAKVFSLILKMKQVAWHTKVHKLSPE